MKNLLYKIASAQVLSKEPQYYSWESKDVESLSKLDISNTDSSHKEILLISIKDENHLDLLLKTHQLDHFNLPTVFVLERSNRNMYRKLLDKHYTHLFIKNECEELLLNYIQYMFNHYELFKTYKSSSILKELNTETLTKKEAQILKLIAESPRKELLRDHLYQKIWGAKETHTNTLDVHLCNLRRKLKTSSYQISTLNNGRIAIHRSNFQKEVSL